MEKIFGGRFKIWRFSGSDSGVFQPCCTCFSTSANTVSATAIQFTQNFVKTYNLLLWNGFYLVWPPLTPFRGQIEVKGHFLIFRFFFPRKLYLPSYVHYNNSQNLQRCLGKLDFLVDRNILWWSNEVLLFLRGHIGVKIGVKVCYFQSMACNTSTYSSGSENKETYNLKKVDHYFNFTSYFNSLIFITF
jgi:hypothetical protein